MKFKSLISVIALLVFATPLPLRAQELDHELETLAEKLAILIKEHGAKKITVLDFTDLHGIGSELGKYIAENLTVDLVMAKRDFAVLDRANLAKILAEHKLTAQGLVDPDNAKMLGKFAGVDALILGTIIPKGENTSLTAKIITTETAEVVGAARGEFKRAKIEPGKIDPSPGRIVEEVIPNVIKTFGALRIELSPLQILGDKQYVLTMSLTNSSAQTLWVGLNDSNTGLRTILRDPEGVEFKTGWGDVSGFQLPGGVVRDNQTLTEIPPRTAVVATVRFSALTSSRNAAPGQCRLQMELIITNDTESYPRKYPLQIVAAKLEAR